MAYNLTVADLHTYFVVVGDAEVLVHNTCRSHSHAEIAERIANGHSFDKHVLDTNEFAGHGIRTRVQFEALVLDVITNPEVSKPLQNERVAYWKDGVFVVYNPHSRDLGTAFMPPEGKPYYDRQVGP